MSGQADDPRSSSVASESRGRRREDPAVSMFVMDVRLRTDPDVATSVRGAAERLSMQSRSPDGLARTTLLISPPGDEVILLPAADARVLTRDHRDDDLRRKVIAAAAGWRSERHRMEKRIRALDWLMMFVEEVQSASTPPMIYDALGTYAYQFVGAYAAVIYGRRDDDVEFLEPLHDVGTEVPPRLAAVALRRFETTSVLTRIEVREDGVSPHPMLAPIFTAFNAAQLVCASIGADALLILVERRNDRVFTGEERDMLCWIVRHAKRALAAMAVATGRAPGD